MSAYYDELFDERDPTRSAGWRHPIEQALRFEFALSALPSWGQDEDTSRSLLDVGCGPGALRRYLRDTNRHAQYIGIDRYAPSVELARQLDPEGQYIEADVLDRVRHHQQFDVVMAIGAAVDGHRYHSDHERRRRLLALVRALCGLCTEYACLVILRQEELNKHASLSHEEALIGATREELDALMRHLSAAKPLRWAIYDGPTSMDRGLFIYKGLSPTPIDPSCPWQVHERVISGPWSHGLEPWRAAWFWWVSGDLARASALLGPEALRGEDARATSLRERLRLERPS